MICCEINQPTIILQCWKFLDPPKNLLSQFLIFICLVQIWKVSWARTFQNPHIWKDRELCVFVLWVMCKIQLFVLVMFRNTASALVRLNILQRLLTKSACHVEIDKHFTSFHVFIFSWNLLMNINIIFNKCTIFSDLTFVLHGASNLIRIKCDRNFMSHSWLNKIFLLCVISFSLCEKTIFL